MVFERKASRERRVERKLRWLARLDLFGEVVTVQVKLDRAIRGYLESYPVSFVNANFCGDMLPSSIARAIVYTFCVSSASPDSGVGDSGRSRKNNTTKAIKVIATNTKVLILAPLTLFPLFVDTNLLARRIQAYGQPAVYIYGGAKEGGFYSPDCREGVFSETGSLLLRSSRKLKRA